jgi:hypothetical protein
MEFIDKQNRYMVYKDGDKWRIKGFCAISGREYITGPFRIKDYRRWKLGRPIEVAMPYLSDADKEYIQYSITLDAFDHLITDEVIDSSLSIYR